MRVRMPRLRPAAWPTSLLVMVGLAVVVGLPAGGYYVYRAYDYVEHDNEFCMSCHLMSGPFEAFARSEHRGLGCKACHQPTLMGRSQMALTQVVEQPEELESHADVPDALCTGCHVEGDPDKWRLIAESAGHRVHLESSDPSLDGVTCVGCHSSSIHEFSATDQTCAQSGCHTDTEIQLGNMGDFTIHCVACHSFRAPLPAEATAQDVSDALRPQANECLSCHVMRAMVELPPDEPHGGACASCHNPHVQTEASEARQTCVNVGCHEVVEEESAFHVGLEQPILQDCVACHTAHDFALDGSNCAGCHTEVAGGASTAAGLGVGAVQQVSQAHVSGPERPFAHARHEEVACLSCHATDGSHGRVTVETADQCQTCHHAPTQAPDCMQCHATSTEVAVASTEVSRSFALSVGTTPSRPLPFDHAVHASESCATCHTGPPPALDARSLDCASCHLEHHQPERSCLSCHLEAPASAHPVAQVHQGCTGAGCHATAPFAQATGTAGLPRTRAFCLTCHQDQQEHRVEGNCADCHALPAVSAG